MTARRPNILVITSRDIGRHLGCYGIEQVNSSHIDALAGEGVRMGNYFATVPICCARREEGQRLLEESARWGAHAVR